MIGLVDRSCRLRTNKLLILSSLDLEFHARDLPKDIGFDIVILAGDAEFSNTSAIRIASA